MDYRLNGPKEKIDSLLTSPDSGDAIPTRQAIGPRILDGVAYVNIRTEDDITVPDGCSETGPELSAALLGVWYDRKKPASPTQQPITTVSN